MSIFGYLSSVTHTDEETKDMTDELTCSICQSQIKNPVVLSCGHSYCCQCFYNYASTVDYATMKCPECRVEVYSVSPDYKFGEVLGKSDYPESAIQQIKDMNEQLKGIYTHHQPSPQRPQTGDSDVRRNLLGEFDDARSDDDSDEDDARGGGLSPPSRATGLRDGDSADGDSDEDGTWGEASSPIFPSTRPRDTARAPSFRGEDEEGEDEEGEDEDDAFGRGLLPSRSRTPSFRGDAATRPPVHPANEREGLDEESEASDDEGADGEDGPHRNELASGRKSVELGYTSDDY
jgi:hypothetical protein